MSNVQCKITSACLHLFPESTFVLRLVGVLLSFFCGRLRGGLRRATHGLPCRAPVYLGCPCQDPPVCHRVQGNPCCVLLESWRRMCLALVLVHHTHVQLRILTPLLDWKRCSSSQLSPMSCSVGLLFLAFINNLVIMDCSISFSINFFDCVGVIEWWVLTLENKKDHWIPVFQCQSIFSVQ